MISDPVKVETDVPEESVGTPWEPAPQRRLIIPIFYREPDRPVYNRAERRRLEEYLVGMARDHIKRHIRQVAAKS